MSLPRHSGAARSAESGIHNPCLSVSNGHWGYGFRFSLRSAGMTAAVLLAGMNGAFAAEAYVGRWAVSSDMCSGNGDSPRNAALVATDASLWWFDGYCRIGKMYKAKAVYVQAHCGAKDVSVTLDAQGDRMKVTWDRRVEELKRCR